MKFQKYVVGGTEYQVITTGRAKTVTAKGFNSRTDMINGQFKRWGATEADDPQWLPSGPELLDLEVSQDGCSMGCAFCSPAGTPVNTPTGEVAIDAISVGDVVLGWGDGAVVPQVVEEVYAHDYTGELVVIECNGREIRLTPEHPVILTDGREVLAGSLQVGDDVRCYSV